MFRTQKEVDLASFNRSGHPAKRQLELTMRSSTTRGAAASLRTIAGEKELYAFYSRVTNENKKEYE
jgi:hypothetical protein